MAIYKNKDIETNINVRGAELGNINVNFYTEDNGTASIRIYILKDNKPINLNNTDMLPRLDLYAQDGSIFTNEPVDIILPEQGLIQYKVTDYAIRHEGKMDCKLFLENGTESVHVANFYFVIKDSGITGAVGKEIHVDILEDMVRNVMTDNAMGLLDDEYKEKINQDVVEYVASNPDKYKGKDGEKGDTGPKGEVGEKGDTGLQGPKGEPLKYSDLTTQQKEELKSNITDQADTDFVLKDGSIETVKLSFTVPKKNLIDPSKLVKGYVLDRTNGENKADVPYANVTDYIKIEPNQWYTSNKYIMDIAFYDNEKNFIKSVVQKNKNITPIYEVSPSNAYYMRGTLYNNAIESAQIEKNGDVTPYEPFKLIINKDYIENGKVSDSNLPIIKLKNTEFLKIVSKNLINTDALIDNSIIDTDGKLFTIANYYVNNSIKVEEKTSYTCQNIYQIGWYDNNDKLISIKEYPATIQSPAGAVVVKVSFSKANKERVMMEKGTTKSPYEPYKALINKDFLELPSNQSTSPNTSNGLMKGFTQSDLVKAEQNANDLIPNVKEPLNIPTYEGSGAATHPSVLYFKNGWNGYKFWMAFTPYPNANNQYENPSIVASNDNVNWVETPTNPVNPIAPLAEGDGYNSDPCIVMKGDTMEMWYRVSRQDSDNAWLPREFYRMTSTDGKIWTSRELMFTGTQVDEEIVSQTIRYVDGKYKMWYVLIQKNTSPVIKYTESNDGKVWITPRTLNITMPDTSYTFWHGDLIINEDGHYEMIMMCKSTTKKWATFYMFSEDNYNWTTPTLIIKSSFPHSKNWDNTDLYRPALVKVEGEYYVYYSTPYKIGLTKGKSLLTLGVSSDNDKLKGYPELIELKNYLATQNAFEPTATFDKYPPYSITTFTVWSAADKGWAELSGVVKTENLASEYTNSSQYFYPAYRPSYYYKRSATSTGWTTWYKYVGSSI